MKPGNTTTEAFERRIWMLAYCTRFGRVSLEVMKHYWSSSLRTYRRDAKILRSVGVMLDANHGSESHHKNSELIFRGFSATFNDRVRARMKG